MRTYKIIGSWSNWKTLEPMSREMSEEGYGSYVAEITLGENRFEQFQIWLDGEPTRVLHPPHARAYKDVPAQGPDDNAHNLNWMIDGRLQQEHGCMGDKYQVHLKIAGRWRTVWWEKIASAPVAAEDDSQKRNKVSASGSYSVVGSWNDWKMEDMAEDPSSPGTFTLEFTIRWSEGAEFQIARNQDWNQVFHPPSERCGDAGSIVGPDSDGTGLNWLVEGNPGERVKIKFHRAVSSDSDDRKVSWETIHTERLRKEDVTPPSYSLKGSWDEYARPRHLEWDGKAFKSFVQLGEAAAEEHFYIIKGGHDGEAIFPNCRNASPHSFHTLQGPGSNKHNLMWTIGRQPEDNASPGARYEVTLQLTQDTSKPKKVVWKKMDA